MRRGVNTPSDSVVKESQVLKPMKWQDLLKEGRNCLNAFRTDAKIHFRKNIYILGLRHSHGRQTRMSSFSVYIYLDCRNLIQKYSTRHKCKRKSDLWKRNKVGTRSDTKTRPLEMKRVRQPAKLCLLYWEREWPMQLNLFGILELWHNMAIY